MSDLPLTLPSLRAAYANGHAPTEIIDQVYRRIARVDDDKIFLGLFDKNDVLTAARSLGDFDPARPLWGVPFAVKDNIDVAGYPTTAACPAYAYRAEHTAFVVTQLQKAGALLVGKTNLDQFATGLVGLRTPYGAPKNALDPTMVPGGSSSGSAVAVAQGIVSFSLGTDTAGSGRVPAALNNIVGLKPSLGALSTSGIVPACRSLDAVSVFAMTVADAYAVAQAAAGFDPSDSYARHIDLPTMPAPPKAVLGVPDATSRRFFGDDCQAAAFETSLAQLAANGMTIRDIDFAPFYAVAEMLYEGAWVAERYVAVEDLIRTRPDALFPVTCQIIKAAEQLTAADAFRGMYRLKDLIRQAEPALDGVDALCVPSIPRFYSVNDLKADPVTPNSNLGTYTNFVNLMDMCGIAVPTGPRPDGRPGSLTFLGASGQDADMAALAAVAETLCPRNLGATDWPLPPNA